MGCWYATCNISNLPIFYGEKVVLIPLVKVSSRETKFNPCYPTDNFLPLGFPIFGEYDEYGRIQNVRTSELNEKHLRQFKYYFAGRDDSEEAYHPVALRDGLDSFVGQVLCCQEGCFIDLNSKYFHPDGKAMVTYMMIHQDIYDALMDNMSNRVPYGHKEPMRDVLRNKLIATMSQIRDFCPSAEECSTPLAYEAFEHVMVRDICEQVFGYPQYFHQYFIWQDMARIINDNVDELVSQIIEMKIWTYVLSYLRKGYLCESGAGSQSCEMKLHLVLAKSVQEHVAMVHERHEWDEDSDEDTIFL